jgi:hypothetical protein
LILFKWINQKNKDLVNSFPLNTPVFIYGKGAFDKDGKKINEYHSEAFYNNYDSPNEFYIKRMLGLDDEEQFYEDTQGYLDGIGKKNDNSITSLRIEEIKSLN